MTHRRNYFLLVSCLAMLAMASVSAQEQPQAPPPGQSPAFENYSAKIMDVLGTRAAAPRTLYVKIYFHTSPEELEKYEQILTEKDSQKKFQNELHKHSDMGRFQIDTDPAYPFKLVVEGPTKKGRRVFLVANRFDMPPRWFSRSDPREFPFTVITLNLDETGKGGGTLNYASKIKFNKKHELEIVDTLSQPAILSGVQKDTD